MPSELSTNLVEIAAEVYDPAKWAAIQLTKAGRPDMTVGEAHEMIERIFREAVQMFLKNLWRCKGCSCAFPDNRQMGANPFCPSCIAKHVLTEQRDALRLRVTELERELDALRMASQEARELVGEADATGVIPQANLDALRALLWRASNRKAKWQMVPSPFTLGESVRCIDGNLPGDAGPVVGGIYRIADITADEQEGKARFKLNGMDGWWDSARFERIEATR